VQANSTAVEIHDLWRIYRAGTSQEVAALRGLSLSVPYGRCIALKGRSGSGKTTLLNCISGLDRPTQGTVQVLGHDLSTLDDNALTEWRRHKIGLIFQSFGLIPTLSAYENVELVLRLAGADRAQRSTRAQTCLDLVGLRKWADHRPYEMSGGQQQRVAIARALANQPSILIADEPTGELDSATSRDILTLFRDIVQTELITILMTSHSPLTDSFVDQVLYLRDGVIVSAETSPELRP
jgi:putative ABC transport system ATP-binding protein